MDKMSFREAQLCVLGARPENAKWDELELNWEQKFKVGDTAEVIAIKLDQPLIVVQIAEGPQSLCHIDNFSDKVLDECVEILRGVAAYYDSEVHKNEMWRIKSNNNPRA